MNLLEPLPLPPGISVHRDDFHEDGVRVTVMRDSDRRCITFTVPIYKTSYRKRVGLFQWEERETIDHERIADELLARGQRAVADLAIIEGRG